MKQTDPNYSPLREKAEAQLADTHGPRAEGELLHELQVHQIELEMQNEHLRQSQLELEASRDRYVDFYDFAPVGYFTLNHEGVIDEANLTGAALLGVPRGQLLQRRFIPFVAPADRERWQRHFVSVLRHDKKLSCELVFQHGDGTRFHALLDCLRLNKDGKETVVRIVLTDIGERIKLERAKQDAHDRYHKITQLVPGTVYQFQLRRNGSTCMPYASEGFHRLFRLHPAEVRKDASRIFSRIHPDDLESMMASIQESARNLTPWQHEFRLKFEDGALLWLFGNSLPQREADGSTLWHGFLSDITARKRAEESLRENEAQWNAIMKILPVGIVIVDTEGEAVFSNETEQQILAGKNRMGTGSLGEYKGWWPSSGKPIEPHEWAAAKAVANGQATLEDEVEIECSDGSRKIVLSSARPLHKRDGSIGGAVIVNQDITWRKQAELTLVAYANELALHNRILKLVSQDAPLAEILDELAREAEALHPEMRCSIMLLDDDGKHLRMAAAPNLPDAYRQGLDGLMIAGDKCACAETVCSCMKGCCESFGVENIQRHSCRLAHLVGMQSCRTQAIVNSEKRVLGAFTVYHPQGLPQGATTSLLENYANLAMLAIEREQARRVLRSEQELKAYQKVARGFSSYLQTMREEEKASIAREIHDDMGGTLTALKMESYWLAEELTGNERSARLLEHIESMGALVDEATNTMRRIITGLRPAMLDDLGLRAAIEWHAAQFNKRTGIECRIEWGANENGKELEPAQSIGLFRIVQEALTNVSRHASASKVAIEFYDNEEEVTLSVRDNGCGIPKHHVAASSSYGMLGMNERVGQLGGKIEFDSPPGGGFRVTVSLPLSADNTKEELS